MQKKVLAKLSKCYSVAPLLYQGRPHFLVAAEKHDRCILFDREGREQATIWEGPGGVMSMVQVPGTDGQFLATHEFYSPNDSAKARIVLAQPEGEEWSVRTIADLPFVHRFDILQRGGRRYLIACTLKSAHAHKDDWSSPGKVYAAELPEDLSPYGPENQLPLVPIKEGVLKNHGYCRLSETGGDAALVCGENGVFRFAPPSGTGEPWQEEQLLETPASDALLIDLDGDGKKELIVMSPFHGDTLTIYRQEGNAWEAVYEYPEKLLFLHAIWGGILTGRPTAVIGHRQGARRLLAFTFEDGAYRFKTLDEDCGPANVYGCQIEGQDILIACNRETDEVAMYYDF